MPRKRPTRMRGKQLKHTMNTRKRTGICVTRYCRKPQCKRGGGYCSGCKMRVWRACNPLKARLANLRKRAKANGVPFDLDIEWLYTFLEANAYDPKIHHIDRKITWGGYTKGNLQVLPYSENIAKGNRERHGQAHMF